MFNQVNQMMWPYMGGWVIVFWALIICGLAYLFWLYRPRGGYSQADPYELARMRYASGEITEEEYERIIQKLREMR